MTGNQGQKENRVGSQRNQKQMRNKSKNNNRFLMRNCKKKKKKTRQKSHIFKILECSTQIWSNRTHRRSGFPDSGKEGPGNISVSARKLTYLGGNPLQCSCLENPRDGKPGGLPSMGRTESDTTEVT